MTDKELRNLSRKELIEMLIDLELENEKLSADMEELKLKLEEKELAIKESGTLAEASFKLNGVFEAADSAVSQYVDSLKTAYSRQQEECDRMLLEAKGEAMDMIKNAESEKQRKMAAADDYWRAVSTKLEAFYNAHPGLKEYFAATAGDKKNERKDRKK